MKKEAVKELKRKGWSEEEIIKAQKIIEARKMQDKSRSHPHSNRILYWSIIFVIIIGNAIISLLLVPFFYS